MHNDTEQKLADFAAKVEKNYEAFYGESVGRPSEESPALARSSSGRMVGLRDLCLVCVLYALTALLMFAVDIVGIETLAAAIYWPPFTVLGAWLLRGEPNNPAQTPEGQRPGGCL